MRKKDLPFFYVALFLFLLANGIHTTSAESRNLTQMLNVARKLRSSVSGKSLVVSGAPVSDILNFSVLFYYLHIDFKYDSFKFTKQH